WQYDRTGRCVSIPYSDRVPPKPCARSWPVREANGHILVYYDRENRPPSHDVPRIPEIAEGLWTRPRRRTWTARVHPQDFSENAVDRAHFCAVHGFGEVVRLEFEPAGPSSIVRFEAMIRMLGRAQTNRTEVRYLGGAYLFSLSPLIRGIAFFISYL